jgi:ribosomal-protein-alanine N-acetyltransferase
MNLQLISQPTIYTPRLELHHIRADHLIDLFETRSDSLTLSHVNFTNPYRVLIDFQGPLAWRVPQVIADESVNRWFVRWVVLRQSQEIIGSASFHGAPDGNGMIEIGLGIEGKFQNQGFGKETLRGLWRWASTFEEVKTFRYTVDPHNLASVALVRSCGFSYIGQQIDEKDGPEDVYEMSKIDFLEGES